VRAPGHLPRCASLHQSKGWCAAQCRQTAHRPGRLAPAGRIALTQHLRSGLVCPSGGLRGPNGVFLREVLDLRLTRNRAGRAKDVWVAACRELAAPREVRGITQLEAVRRNRQTDIACLSTALNRRRRLVAFRLETATRTSRPPSLMGCRQSQ
jgi:hypothetical protein